MPPLHTRWLTSAPDLAGSGHAMWWWHHTRCCSPQILKTLSACSSTTLKASCLHFPNPLPKVALWEGAGIHLTSLALSEQDQGVGREAQAGGSSQHLVVQQHIPGCGMQQGAGGSSRAVSQPSTAAFAWQRAFSFQLWTAHWWLSCSLSPCTRNSSKQPLLLPDPKIWGWLGHCAKVNIYVAGAFLPLPCIFSPFLKCHRSAVFIIVQEMSSLLAGSLTPACAGSTVAAPLISVAGSCIHPRSSEDGFGHRGDGTVRNMGTEPHDYGSPSRSCSFRGTPIIPWSTGQIRIPGDPTLCLCHFRANIQTRLTQLPACTQWRAHSGNSGIFQACDFFVLRTKPRSLEMLLKGLLSIGDFSSQEEIC